MAWIEDWNGKRIEVGASRGGTLALADPMTNLVFQDGHREVYPELLQKLYVSNQGVNFAEEQLLILTQRLGYYCDLQSIQSEDAITWSCFGTVAHASEPVREQFVRELLRALRVEVAAKGPAEIWLWRRIPHPDTLVSGGPELDVGIMMGDVLVFGEAKWRSGVGASQGIRKDKDQLTLRREFFEKYGNRVFPRVSKFVLLGISLAGEMVKEEEVDISGGTMIMRDVTWDQLAGMRSHPMGEELQRYVAWKKLHSVRK